MKILVVSNNYPSLKYPSRGVFVYNLIQQFCKLGHQVTVISPENILATRAKKGKILWGGELYSVPPKIFFCI